MENQLDFDIVMGNFKLISKSKNDTQIAEKLGMNRATYSDRKQRKSIPLENLLIYCKKEDISIDKIMEIQENSTKNENLTENLEKEIKKLTEKETEYFFHLIKAKNIEKELNN